MKLICYPLLQTTSRRALRREKTKWGRTYWYTPRADLLERLSHQTGMSKTQVFNQLMKERMYFLRQL